MRVEIPSQLFSYTHTRQTEAHGATLDEILRDLDRQFPGLRFRIVSEQNQIRPHILIVIAKQPVRDLFTRVPETETVRIIGALSGG